MEDIDKSDWTDEMKEEDRLERLFSDFFYDEWLAFEKTFTAKALVLGITDEDAEKYAAQFDAEGRLQHGFAYLLRQIKHERNSQRIYAMITAAFQDGLPDGGVSIPDIVTAYNKLPKGEA